MTALPDDAAPACSAGGFYEAGTAPDAACNTNAKGGRCCVDPNLRGCQPDQYHVRCAYSHAAPSPCCTGDGVLYALCDGSPCFTGYCCPF